jgi:oligopeptide transport system substrate-binding protein
MFAIRGAEAYYRARLAPQTAAQATASAVGIAVIDEHTLRVSLARPCPYFLSLTAFPTFAPVYPPALESGAASAADSPPLARHLWTRPGHLIGNGAFRLTRWDFKQRLRMERNSYYWDARGLAINSLEICICSDPNAILTAYETGRIDLARSLSPSAARVLDARRQAGQRPDFHIGDRFATFFYRVNCLRPPLDNPALRRALALAIDREALCTAVLGLGETPAYSYVPPSAAAAMAGVDAAGHPVNYVSPPGLGAGLTPAQRCELARRCLRESGYDPQNGRALELLYAPEPDQQRIAEAVQQMWQAALGIQVVLRTQEVKVISTRIRNLDYDLVRSNWYGDYLDPSTFLNMFTGDDGQNRTGWSHDEYNRLIAAAARDPGAAARFELLQRAERVLCVDEAPIILLFHGRGYYLLNPRFADFADNLLDVLPIHRVQRRAAGP